MVPNAIHVMRIATGEIEEEPTNAAAVILGRKGGHARAASLSKARRLAIARKAARSRWLKKR